jgi:N-acetylmuramoyl-L-alanine amidase
MCSTEEALNKLRDPQSKVSAHYLISKDGLIYNLVAEEKRAWHAGISCWKDRVNLNHPSIGIELDNPGHTNGYEPFPPVQMNALIDLIKDIRTRWTIPNYYILGHSDIAIERKADPGELFDWNFLAKNNIGLWPQNTSNKEISAIEAVKLLKDIGYCFESDNLDKAILAFQRHFLPQNLSSVLDKSTITQIQDVHACFTKNQ